MRRLLWKEWHEIRWYFIGLLAGPWLLTFLAPMSYYADGNTHYVLDAGSERFQLLLLVLMFWGATRLSGENRPGRLSMRTLPINQWMVLTVKLVPGLFVACLLPLWIHVAVTSLIKPLYMNGVTPAYFVWENLWLLVSAYLVSFALSILTSAIVAVLIGWLLVFFAVVEIQYGVLSVYLQALMSLVGLILGPAIWLKGTSSGIKRRVGIGAIAILVALPVFLTGLYFIPWHKTNQLSLMMSIIHSRPRVGPTYVDYNYASHSISPDGTLLAYTADEYSLDKKTGFQKTTTTLRVWDFRHRKTLLEQKDVRPISWFPDGKLLIVVSRGSSLILAEWDPQTQSRLTLLTSPGSRSIRGIIPSTDGRKIALFIEPRRIRGVDLWMLDRASDKLKLIRPGLAYWQHDDAWDGDRLIFQRRYNEYWSIRSDGSGLKPIGIGGRPCEDF